jgi:hypothetical protein
MTKEPNERVQYWAVSIFNSRTAQLNTVIFLIDVLSLTEVVSIIPVRYLPMYNALIPILNIGMRMLTVRPVALIAPGLTQPVSIKKIGPPKEAPPVTD